MISINRAIVTVSALLLTGSQLVSPASASKWTYGLWSFEISKDDCHVAEIVRDYFASGKRGEIPHKRRHLFRQDQDARERLRYQERDWHLLKHIVDDHRFAARPGCASTLAVESSINGDREGTTNDFNLFQVGERHLCQATAFWRNLNTASGRKRVTGQVNSCINVQTRKTTFDVQRSEE